MCFCRIIPMSRLPSALIAAIETPENQKAYRKELLQHFDVDGSFQVFLLTCEGLDSMDTVERRSCLIEYRYIFEDISHNASFFYYNSDFCAGSQCTFGRVFV